MDSLGEKAIRKNAISLHRGGAECEVKETLVFLPVYSEPRNVLLRGRSRARNLVGSQRKGIPDSYRVSLRSAAMTHNSESQDR